MRPLLPIIVAAFGLVGCESSPPPKPVSFDPFHGKAFYAVLKSEPVPLPQRSPYDGDVRQREAYNEGFRSGWDCAISGALLHGTFGTPTDLPKDLHEAWSAGWKSGAKTGNDRWFTESKRQQETLGQPDGPANRSQPARVETSQASPAGASGRSP
jgi:hypothetical protein